MVFTFLGFSYDHPHKSGLFAMKLTLAYLLREVFDLAESN